MGNDSRFVQAEDLPIRLIEVPVGSAPPPPSPPYIRRTHIENKRHAPPIPPPRVDGYDAPPSLPPPPAVSRRFDVPPRSDLRPIQAPPRSDLPRIQVPPRSDLHPIQAPPRSDLPRIQVPPRSDLPQSYPKTTPTKYVLKQRKYYARKIRKPKMACCVIC